MAKYFTQDFQDDWDDMTKDLNTTTQMFSNTDLVTPTTINKFTNMVKSEVTDATKEAVLRQLSAWEMNLTTDLVLKDKVSNLKGKYWASIK